MSILNILNEEGKIIGKEERDVIHRDGLRHQEINVWFHTPQGEIIFQHRARDKDTWSDKLDATAGGHVELGDDYDRAAVLEIKEETGLDVGIDDLESMGVFRTESIDVVGGTENKTFREVYIYQYEGDIEDLVIEEGAAIGFEAWKIDDVLNMKEKDKKRFIPSAFSDEVMDIFRVIKKRLDK